jgi:hypothetical protein
MELSPQTIKKLSLDRGGFSTFLEKRYAEKEVALSSNIVLHSCHPDSYKQRYKI